MNLLQFLASVVGSLAWPMTLVWLVYFLREPLLKLFARLASLKYKDLEIDFTRELNRIELDISSEIAQKGSALESIPIETTTNDDQFHRLIDVLPSAAVIEAWKDVDEAIKRMALHHGINLDRKRSVLYLTRVLQQKGIIDKRTAQILDDLRALRNAAVHPEGKAITRDDAVRFRELSDEVVRILAASAD